MTPPDIPIPLRVFLPAMAWALPVLAVLWFRYQRIPRNHTFSPLIIAIGMSIIVGGLFFQSFVQMAGDDAFTWILVVLFILGTLTIIILRVEGTPDITNVM